MWLFPPVLFVFFFAFGVVVWTKAKLRSMEFWLPTENPHELSVAEVKEKVDLMSSRLAWFATATVFCISAGVSILTSILVILDMRRDFLGRALAIGISALVAGAILGYFWVTRSQYSGPRFLDELLDRTSGQIVPHWILGLANGLAFAGIAFIAGASSSVISSPGRLAEEVSRQVDDLGWLLYAGAALLITSILEINQLHRWSGIAVLEDVRHEIHRAAAVLAGTIAVFFTLVLAAAYIPAFLVLRLRVIPVHQSIGSTFHTVLNVAVIFSPMVVGLASSFWNSLPTESSR
jgi:hypothetical protein